MDERLFRWTKYYQVNLVHQGYLKRTFHGNLNWQTHFRNWLDKHYAGLKLDPDEYFKKLENANEKDFKNNPAAGKKHIVASSRTMTQEQMEAHYGVKK